MYSAYILLIPDFFIQFQFTFIQSCIHLTAIKVSLSVQNSLIYSVFHYKRV